MPPSEEDHQADDQGHRRQANGEDTEADDQRLSSAEAQGSLIQRLGGNIDRLLIASHLPKEIQRKLFIVYRGHRAQQAGINQILAAGNQHMGGRSEERRVGKEC